MQATVRRTVAAWQRGQSARTEPFDAVELEVGVLFGGDPEV
jgi:hypothetical protein